MGAKHDVPREGKEQVVRPFESEPLRHGKVPTEGTGQAFGGVKHDEKPKEPKDKIEDKILESSKRKKRGRA